MWTSTNLSASICGRTEVEEQPADAAELLQIAIDVLNHPAGLYRRADDANRPLLLQTFFERLYVDDDGVSGTECLVTKTKQAPSGAEAPVQEGEIGTHARLGVGSGKAARVEVAGIEPASFDDEPGLLRVQPAAVLLGPSDHAGKSLTGPVTAWCPAGSRDRIRR